MIQSTKTYTALPKDQSSVHISGSSQPFVTSAPGALMPISVLHGHCPHVCTDILAGKTAIHISKT